MYTRTVSVARIGTLLSALTVTASPLALAQSAGTSSSGPAPAATGAAAVSQAEALLKDNRPVEARSILQRVLAPEAAPLSKEDSATAFQLLMEANKAIQSADPLDVSLSKARLAMQEGDIRTAEHHARAVSKSPTANPRQSAQAWKVLDEASARKRELAPAVPEALAQAIRDFEAGRYAQAKNGLSMVYRSGVELNAPQQDQLADYQSKIVDLERSRGEVFGATASAGMMQPGVVRRRDDQKPAQPPAAQPPAAQPPAAQPPAAQPPAEQPPAEQPAAKPPAEQPAAQPAPQPPPSGDDLIQQAMRFEAQSLLAQADQAMRESRLNEAQSKYLRLRNEYRQYLTADQFKHVEEKLEEVRVRAGQGADILGGLQGDLKQVHDRTLAVFNNQVEEAQRALRTGDTDRARDLAARARLTLNEGRAAFAESEFENLRNRADSLVGDISKTEVRLTEERLAAQERERQAQASRSATQAERDRERKINELLDRARAYQQDMRYKDALQAVDQLLFLDPINPAGLILRDVYRDNIIYRQYQDLQDRRRYLYATNSLENQDAAIPPAGIMNYPSDWPQISVRRGEQLAFNDTEDNRRVMAELDNKSRRIPSVRFADNSFADVVRFIGDLTQLNIDVDWTSLEAVGIRRDSPVSLSLSNVTPKTVLDRVVKKVGDGGLGGADWAIYDGIVTVASEDAIRKNTTLVIYDVRDLLIEIPDYSDVPRIDLQSVLQSNSGGGGGQSPFQNANDNNDRQQQRRQREDKVEELVSIITQSVDLDGWVDNGGTTGKILKMVNQGQLIITNTAKNHQQIAGLLSKLREQRAMQINVEARFLLVNQDFFEQIGFDLDLYLNANNNQVRAARVTDPGVQASDFFLDGRLRRTIQGPGALQGAPAPITQNTVNPRHWSPIGFQQDSLGLASGLAPSSGFAHDILGGAPALGIAGQFLDDIQVDFVVQATQANRRSVQLTAPRLTFTNGQTANIYVATQQAFVSALQATVADSAVGFNPTVSVVSEGVTLLVEGTVTADRRYVTMNLDAGVSRIDGFAQQPVTAVAGGQLVNSADTQSFIQLPTVTVTRVRSSITVPDQGTILMGGQRLVTEFSVETGVPVLSKIPILNRFFTNRIESKEEQTLLILVKPTIIIQNEEEERHFPGLPGQLGTGYGG
jgi:Flp pilus assembly secretin CpaC